MADRFKLNPFTGQLDNIGQYAAEVGAAPTNKSDGYMAVVGDTLYYFSGGDRYKLVATLDNPSAGTSGSPMGLLLLLTYP
jgi:hypothetical protein